MLTIRIGLGESERRFNFCNEYFLLFHPNEHCYQFKTIETIFADMNLISQISIFIEYINCQREYADCVVGISCAKLFPHA